MSDKTPKKGSGYAWAILVGCCALSAGGGLMINTDGQWFPAVTAALNCGTGDLSMFTAVRGVTTAITALFCAKLFTKIDLRILFTACAIILAVTMATMSTYTALWQFYLAGAICGVVGCILFNVPVPIILGNWFLRQTGLMIGIAAACTNLMAALTNPIFAELIVSIGWREAFLIRGIMIGVLLLPFTIFILRYKPSDMGRLPWGYGKGEQAGEKKVLDVYTSGVTSKTAFRSPAFWLIFIACGIFAFGAGCFSLLPSYAGSMGLMSIIGTVASMAMIGGVAGKLFFGWLADRVGALVVTILALALAVIGFLMLIFFGSNEVLVIIGSFFYGMFLSMTAVVAPLIIRQAFGELDYADIFSKTMFGVSFVGCFGTSIFGYIFDATGTFTIPFIFGIALLVASALCVFAGVALAKRLPKAESTTAVDAANNEESK